MSDSGKSKKKQALRGVDLLSTVLLLVIVVGISTVIVVRELRDIDKALGQDEAENLAFQLMNGGFALPDEAGRGPASINNSNGSERDFLGIFRTAGEIGQDPWGRAFRYRVLRNSEGSPKYVVVWSSGPNRELETLLEDESLKNEANLANLKFGGDDFGYVHSLR